MFHGANSLAVAVVEDCMDDETVEFKFTHDQGYQTCQDEFYALANHGEPINLIVFLIKNRKLF